VCCVDLARYDAEYPEAAVLKAWKTIVLRYARLLGAVACGPALTKCLKPALPVPTALARAVYSCLNVCCHISPCIRVGCASCLTRPFDAFRYKDCWNVFAAVRWQAATACCAVQESNLDRMQMQSSACPDYQQTMSGHSCTNLCGAQHSAC